MTSQQTPPGGRGESAAPRGESAAPRGPFPAALPVATGAEAVDLDLRAQHGGIPGAVLMESAGRAAAELAVNLAPQGPLVVLVGAGNNGGDALVAARTLTAWGRDVRLVCVPPHPAADPRLHGWRLPHLTAADDALSVHLDAATLVIDGLLGTGLKGPPRSETAALIDVVNAAAVRLLALDVPSGVIADTGQVPGAAIRADCTLAFGWPKLGTLIGPGRTFVGRLLAAEIGFPPLPEGAFRARLLTPEWAAAVCPRRSVDTHKKAVGSLTLVAGSPGMAGAALLSGRAALRSGAGYLRVLSAAANREIVQTSLPDALWADLDNPTLVHEALTAAGAVAAGPGLGRDAHAEAALTALLDGPATALVLDADALNLLAEGRPRSIAALGATRPIVLTPHPGEAARLLELTVAEVQADRPAAVRELARRSLCTVVLKGMPSLVSDPRGLVDIAAPASSELAVAGMGDVLTGTIGALLAQGATPRDAAGLALLAGASAARACALGAGLAASDVPDRLPAALAGFAAYAGFRAEPSELRFPWLTLDLEAPR